MTRLTTVNAASELLLGRVGPERIDVSWWKLAVMLWCCEGGGAVELDDAVDSAASDASETGGGLCGAGDGGVGTVDWGTPANSGNCAGAPEFWIHGKLEVEIGV